MLQRRMSRWTCLGVSAVALLAAVPGAAERTSASYRITLDVLAGSGSAPRVTAGGAGTLRLGTSQGQAGTVGRCVGSSPGSARALGAGFWEAVGAADADGDGIGDVFDNCTEQANASQVDTDGDGYGNACDCDFDQSGACNIGDFNLFLPSFAAGSDAGIGTDMDANGSVNIGDFNLFLVGFTRGSPGPAVGLP